jgi:hypothetical protein
VQRLWSLDVLKIGMLLRRSKIFIVTVTPIAVSSGGAAYHGQHLQTDLHPYRAVETLQRAARPMIHFPTRGARLDAAPTELLLAVDGAPIKISLLRSMFPVIQCREGTASSSPPGPLEICKRCRLGSSP